PSMQRRSLVAASTRMTHSDPRALWAAQAIADVVAMECETAAAQAALLNTITAVAPDEEWQKVCVTLRDHLERGSDAATYAAALGLANGVTGYALHSAPVALFCWLRYRPDFATAMRAALQLGGDTDSVGAMVGAMAGASIGALALPATLIDTIVDWPISVALIRQTGHLLGAPAWRDDAIARRRRWYFWPGQLVRNVVVFGTCVVHLLRRAVRR
nr:ADP-ribosylglycohydrolase family protein [Kofleriaceae bacterium]